MKLTQTNWIAATLAAAAILGSEGVANELVFSQEFVNVDYISVGCGGMRTWLEVDGRVRGTRDGVFTITGVPEGRVSKAILYWHGDAPFYRELTPGTGLAVGIEENPASSVVFRRVGTSGAPITGQAVYLPQRNTLILA